MLRVEQIDLDDIAQGRDDHSYETSWWLDPDTGAVAPWMPDAGLDEDEHPEERGWEIIHPRPSGEAYQDMADFVEQVRDVRARDLLDRAITGRGAFRRFKDTLFDFPDVREAWFAFRDARSRRDALEWLAEMGHVDRAEAEGALLKYADPASALLGQPIDAEAIARSVAAALRELYGDRLKQVLLFGSYARGTAHDESDLDLLVVLDGMQSPYAEVRAMADVLWDHSLATAVAISAVPVTADDYANRSSAFLTRVRAEAQTVP